MRMIDSDKLLDDITAIENSSGMGYIIASAFKMYVNQQPTLTPQNEWVSVEERLPESIVNKVLVYCENGYIGYGHFEKYQGEETWYNLESGEPFASWNLENCSSYKVTHWMSLPEPPEGEDGDANHD